MQIGIRILGHIVVENNVYAFDVHSTSKEIRRHEKTLVEVLESLITLQPLLLRHCAVHCDRGKVLIDQKLG